MTCFGVSPAFVFSRHGTGFSVGNYCSSRDAARKLGFECFQPEISYADALAASEKRARESGALPIHAFDQEETLMGTGTLGLELEEQAPQLDTVLIAVGGGGLLAGAAAWYENRVRVIGVEPEGAPTLTRALEAGKPVDAPTGSIAADSLSPQRVGELVFPLVQSFVERVLLVSDDAITRSQQTLWERIRVVAEPGGAAAFAALVSGVYQPAPGERVGVVISGGNTVAVDAEGNNVHTLAPAHWREKIAREGLLEGT